MINKLRFTFIFLIFNIIFSIPFIPIKTFSMEKIDESNYLEKSFEYENYILGPGDIINLNFANGDVYDGNYRILNDGNMSLPIIGRKYVKDLDLNQLERILFREYSKKLLNPDLTINIISTRAIKVSVIGEVMKPGLYSFESNKDDLPTVISSLIQAGGITPESNLRNVQLIRKLPGRNGGKKVASLNLVDFILKGDQSQNLPVFDGDILILEKAKSLENTEILLSSNIYSQVIQVNVVGQVLSPGATTIPAKSSLIEAIMAAGGPIKWKANRGNIELFRINENGTAYKKRYKLDLAKGISDESNPILKNGDLIKVNTTLLNNVTTGLGAATEPLSSVLNAIALIKLLN